jgi:two-component system, LytTR family, response regulator
MAEQRPQDYQQHFLVAGRAGTVVVPVERIEWIEGAGDYVTLHSGRRSHLVRTTMKALEARLDPARMWRVHRSAFVNPEAVTAVADTLTGVYVLTLACGASVRVSRRYARSTVHKLRAIGRCSR